LIFLFVSGGEKITVEVEGKGPHELKLPDRKMGWNSEEVVGKGFYSRFSSASSGTKKGRQGTRKELERGTNHMLVSGRKGRKMGRENTFNYKFV